MRRWIRGLVLASATLVALVTLAPSPFAQGLKVPAVTGNRVGWLDAHVPPSGTFSVHGTLPIPQQPFQRNACPVVLVDPAGRTLTTQWELVARLKNTMVVELLATATNDQGWTGRQRFEVYEGANNFVLPSFDPSLLSAISTPDVVRLRLRDQDDVDHDLSLSGVVDDFHRLGPAVITARKTVKGPYGAIQVWMTVRSGVPGIELILNWHNGGLPANPDVYFRSLALVVPPGFRWTPVLPDPAIAYPLLVRKGQHVLPQRWERSFRVVVHDDDVTPDVSMRGWAVGDWSGGGYMPQSLRLPDLSHTKIDLTPRKLDDFDRLAKVLPTSPGSTPVGYLYPAQGVFYGGMTGGLEIHQFPRVDLAFSGQPDGLLSTYVEQLRYACRQMGGIYGDDGWPIAQDDYLNPDGTQPWEMFNNEFLGNPPRDAPFYFHKTGPGVGSSTYDPNDYWPIDYQHYVRRTKANKALVWLDNDPLARLYVLMDAELGRMCFYEGKGGRLRVPSTGGLGTARGRAEAWVADVMAAAHAVSGKAWRQRNAAWFQTFADVFRVALMPNQLFSAQNFGKTATSPPYGDGRVAFYWVHRSNEQIFLMHALRGIQETVGIDSSASIRACGEGLWRFAWKAGTNGPLDAYPAGPVGGPRYSTRSQIPAGLTTTVWKDPYHVANAIANAQEMGAYLVPAILAHTGAPDLVTARDVFEAWGLSNLPNRAWALSLLQDTVP
jgi:hypothetical protein